MAGPPLSPAFDTDFAPRPGTVEKVAPGIVRLTAPNAGPYTFAGTNAFVLGDERVVIVDPGPAGRGHLEALLKAIGGRPVDAIVLTHTHHDHCAGVPALRKRIDAPLWRGADLMRTGATGFPGTRLFTGLAREARLPLKADRLLADGEVVVAGGVALDVIATPGHAADHLCLGLKETPWLLSGDHVMGWNSTMIIPGAGALSQYLASLEKLISRPYRHYLPAHGGPVPDGPAFAQRLLNHRRLRNEQIVRLVREGAQSLGALRRALYPGLSPPLRLAARATLLAHLEYLEETGQVAVRRGLLGIRVEPAAP